MEINAITRKMMMNIVGPTEMIIKDKQIKANKSKRSSEKREYL